MIKSGYIFDIKKFAIHDGPGIRTTIFMKGCPLDCWWCHNPESKNQETELIEKVRKPGEQEEIGKKVSVEEIFEEIEKDRIFYDESGGGVTFSGGEALMQHEFLSTLLDKCKVNDIHTVLDTSGYAPQNVIESISDKVDLFLFDLKIMDEALHKKYTGVSNILILSNLKLLNKKRKNIIIRFPIIPGITDTKDNVKELSEFVKTLNNIQRIDILAYNKLGIEKYRRLGRECRTLDLAIPSEDSLEEIKTYFEEQGHNVKIGG